MIKPLTSADKCHMKEELILIKDYDDEQGIILKKGTKVISLGRTANEKLEQIGYSTSDGRSRTYLPLAVLGRKTPSPPVCAIATCTRSGPVYKCTGCATLYHNFCIDENCETCVQRIMQLTAENEQRLANPPPLSPCPVQKSPLGRPTAASPVNPQAIPSLIQISTPPVANFRPRASTLDMPQNQWRKTSPLGRPTAASPVLPQVIPTAIPPATTLLAPPPAPLHHKHKPNDGNAENENGPPAKCCKTSTPWPLVPSARAPTLDSLDTEGKGSCWFRFSESGQPTFIDLDASTIVSSSAESSLVSSSATDSELVFDDQTSPDPPAPVTVEELVTSSKADLVETTVPLSTPSARGRISGKPFARRDKRRMKRLEDEVASLRREVIVMRRMLRDKVRFDVTCDICNNKYTTAGALKLHIRTKHRNERFMCEVDGCEHHYSQNWRLMEHIARKHKNGGGSDK